MTVNVCTVPCRSPRWSRRRLAAGVAHGPRRMSQLLAPAQRWIGSTPSSATRSHHQPLSWPIGGLMREGFGRHAASPAESPSLALGLRVGRLELEHAKAHPAEVFAVLVRERRARRDEVADARAGGLLFGDLVDHRLRRHQIAELQVALVVLFGVGAEHARVAVVGQQLVEAVLLVASARRSPRA